MTVSLLFSESSTYRLIHDGRDVGWLAGNSLVFTGFDSLDEADRAGDAGYLALLNWLDGASATTEWSGQNGRALARVIRPAEDEGFVVEFTLPRSVHTVAAARAASRMFDAMRRALHGAWPHTTRVEELNTVASD
jgi:hypothetical protein